MLNNINTINTISNNKNDDDLILKLSSIVIKGREKNQPTQNRKLYTAVDFLFYTVQFSIVSWDQKFFKDFENV